jgi:hypothetical protein
VINFREFCEGVVAGVIGMLVGISLVGGFAYAMVLVF